MYIFKFLPDFTIVIAIIASRYYTVLTKSQILFSPRVLRKESPQTRVYVLLKTPCVQNKIIENSRSLVGISFERRHEATRSFYPICIHVNRSLILRGSKQRNLRSRAASETGGAERSRTSRATVLVGFIFWNSLYVGAHQPARKYSPALGSCIFISSGRTQHSDRNNGHGFRRDTRPNLF